MEFQIPAMNSYVGHPPGGARDERAHSDACLRRNVAARSQGQSGCSACNRADTVFHPTESLPLSRGVDFSIRPKNQCSVVIPDLVAGHNPRLARDNSQDCAAKGSLRRSANDLPRRLRDWCPRAVRTGFPPRLPGCATKSCGEYVAPAVRFLAQPTPGTHVPEMVLRSTADEFF